jgi:hypothetical protein
MERGDCVHHARAQARINFARIPRDIVGCKTQRLADDDRDLMRM